MAADVRQLQGTRDSVIELTGQLKSLKEDLNNLFEGFRTHREELRRDQDQRRLEAQAQEQKRRDERRSDFRWIIGTIIAAGSLIIGAVGILFA